VKINHSVLEMVCAKHLIKAGYCVEVEYQLNDWLTCDLYAVKGEGRLILEIETGFTPPEHALDPYTYNKARTASKIARYSSYADKFVLGTTPTNILPIPPVFLKPPKYRRVSEVKEVKTLCDAYYRNPPVSCEEIKNSRLHAIYIIDVDKGTVREIDPEIYVEIAFKLPLMRK
jgi:hypothetical protein